MDANNSTTTQAFGYCKGCGNLTLTLDKHGRCGACRQSGARRAVLAIVDKLVARGMSELEALKYISARLSAIEAQQVAA